MGTSVNKEMWVKLSYREGKIRRNQTRDGKINQALENLGWRVLRIWESSLRDEEAVAAKLSLAL